MGRHRRQRRQVYRRAAEALDQLLGYEKGTMLETKWKDLPEEARRIWLWGYDEPLAFNWRGGRKSRKFSGSFDGFIPELIEKYRTTRNKMQRKHLEKYMETMDCPDCHGKRLNQQASAVTLKTDLPNSKALRVGSKTESPNWTSRFRNYVNSPLIASPCFSNLSSSARQRTLSQVRHLKRYVKELASC